MPDYPGPGKDKVTVDVPAGSSLDVIGGILVEKDVVKSTQAWNQAVRSEERATRRSRPGSYMMKTQMRAIDALRLLINPGSSRVRSKFTVPEGLRLSAQVDVLVKGTKIKKSSFQAALKQAEEPGPALVREEPPRGLPVPRHLRADRRVDRHLDHAADGRPVQVAWPGRSSSRPRPRS